MNIILGSSSPRRKELLSKTVSSFTVKTADINEEEFPGEPPLEHCRRLSEEKGAEIRRQLGSQKKECLVITSDTIVTAEERILGKPADRDMAFEMLSFLSGKSHQVITAITLSLSRDDNTWHITTDHEITRVDFKELSSREINEYLDLVHYSDKAGSYAIQEHGERIIDSIEGSRSNVIGFPEDLFRKMLQKLPVNLEALNS